MARERDKQQSVHSFQQEVAFEGVKWEQPGSWKQFLGGWRWGKGGAREGGEAVERIKKGARRGGVYGSCSDLGVRVWEDKFERLPAGSREGKETPERPCLAGAGGRAGQRLRAEGKSVLVLSCGKQGGEFPGQADPTR